MGVWLFSCRFRETKWALRERGRNSVCLVPLWIHLELIYIEMLKEVRRMFSLSNTMALFCYALILPENKRVTYIYKFEFKCGHFMGLVDCLCFSKYCMWLWLHHGTLGFMNPGELMWQLQSSLWATLQQEDLHTTGWRLVRHSPQHISGYWFTHGQLFSFVCGLPLLLSFPAWPHSLKEVLAQGTSVLFLNTTISREEGKEFYFSSKIKLQWSPLDKSDSRLKIIQTFLSRPLQACFLQLRVIVLH